MIPFPHRDAGCESWGRGQRFGFVPLGPGRLYWYATANVPAGSHDPPAQRRELRRRFGQWHDPIPEVLERTPESVILRNDLYDRKPLGAGGRGG